MNCLVSIEIKREYRNCINVKFLFFFFFLLDLNEAKKTRLVILTNEQNERKSSRRFLHRDINIVKTIIDFQITVSRTKTSSRRFHYSHKTDKRGIKEQTSTYFTYDLHE